MSIPVAHKCTQARFYLLRNHRTIKHRIRCAPHMPHGSESGAMRPASRRLAVPGSDTGSSQGPQPLPESATKTKTRGINPQLRSCPQNEQSQADFPCLEEGPAVAARIWMSHQSRIGYAEAPGRIVRRKSPTHPQPLASLARNLSRFEQGNPLGNTSATAVGGTHIEAGH